jgi:hypothetical protein
MDSLHFVINYKEHFRFNDDVTAKKSARMARKWREKTAVIGKSL